jgi:uncharacterized protein (TIGR00251 family)
MYEAEWLRSSEGRLLISVKVMPGAARSGAAGLRGGALLLRVAAPPEKGKANEALRGWLADALGLPKSEVLLVSGGTSRRKLLSLPLRSEAALRSLAESRIPGRP